MRILLLLTACAVSLSAQAPRRPARIDVHNAAPIPGDTTDHMDLNVTGFGQMLATVYDSANVPIPGVKVYWVSGNPSVASVDRLTGRVAGKKVGYATIYGATASGLSASARACIVPSGMTRLDPHVEPNSVRVFSGRTLIPANTLKVGDTAQMRLTLALHGRDTSARNIQTWGPCVHWVLNAGPATPVLPDSNAIRVSAHGMLSVRCCTTMFYPSATLGTERLAGLPVWRSSGAPSLRIAESVPVRVGASNWSLLAPR